MVTIMKMTIIDIGRIGERRFAYNLNTKEILSRRTKINAKMIRIILPSAPLTGYLLYSYIKIPVPDSPLKCLIVTTITLCINLFIMVCLIMRVSEHIVNVKRFDILGTIEDLSNKNVEKLKKIEGENLVIGTLIFFGDSHITHFLPFRLLFSSPFGYATLVNLCYFTIHSELYILWMLVYVQKEKC